MQPRINKKGIRKHKTGDKNIGIGKKKKINNNQLESLSQWISYYEENKKLPYDEIICCECKSFTAKMKGVGFKHALKNADGDIKKMLVSTMCKDCKQIKQPKEKKPVVKKIKTREEIEEEIEQIRRDTPKIDLHSPNVVIDLVKNKSECQRITENMCMRPDIYLNNDRTCDNCRIKENCACPIKRFANKTKKK